MDNFLNLIVKCGGQVTSSFKSTKKQVEDLNKTSTQIANTNITPKVSSGFTEKLKGLKEGFGGVKDQIKGMATEAVPALNNGFAEILMGINPVVAGLTAIGIAGVTTASKLSSIASEYKTLRDSYLKITNDINDATNSANLAKTISEQFGVEEKELRKSANVLAREFGISTSEALRKVKDGIILSNGELANNLDWINEYASKFKEQGATAEDFFVTLSKGFEGGSFNDKVLDFFKEANIRVSEMADNTKKALISAGVNVDDYQKKIKEGNITQYQATRQILQTVLQTQDAQVKQNAIASLGSATLEDQSYKSLQNIAQYQGSLDDLKKGFTDTQKGLDKRFSLENEINAKQQEFSSSFLGFNSEFKGIWDSLRLGFWNFLVGLKPVLDPFIEGFKSFWSATKDTIGIVWDLSKFVLSTFWVGLKPLIGAVGWIFQMIARSFELFGDVLDTYIKPGIDWLNEKIGKLIDNIMELFGMLGKSPDGKTSRDKVDEQQSKRSKAIDGYTLDSTGIAKSLKDFEDSKKLDKKLNDSVSSSNIASRVVAETKSIIFKIENFVRIDKNEVNNMGDYEDFEVQLSRVLTNVINNSQA